jgi:hypothetical protein
VATGAQIAELVAQLQSPEPEVRLRVARLRADGRLAGDGESVAPAG